MAFLTPHRDAGLLSEQGQHHELELGREVLWWHKERGTSPALMR